MRQRDMPTRRMATMARTQVEIILRETHGETRNVPTSSHCSHAEQIKALAADHVAVDIRRPIRGAADRAGRMTRPAVVIQMNRPTTTGSAAGPMHHHTLMRFPRPLSRLYTPGQGLRSYHLAGYGHSARTHAPGAAQGWE